MLALTEKKMLYVFQPKIRGASEKFKNQPPPLLTLIRMTKDEKVLAVFKGLLL